MVEVIVSVALLTVFSVAAMMAITSGTAASSDNRARVTAAGLAQRELDYASQAITASVNGAKALLNNGGLGVNEHVPAEMETADPEFGFSIDGERYRVERRAAPYDNGVNSPCVNPNPSDLGAQPAFGLIVTVTVTWESMGASSRPHVASKIFPPQRGAATGLDPGQSQLVVSVEGRDRGADPAGPVLGVDVVVTGPNVLTPQQATNTAGCAIFLVEPEPSGSEYTVEVRGYQGSSAYVGLDNQVNATKTEQVMPGESKSFPFTDYSRAARLTVAVAGGYDDLAVEVWPLTVGGNDDEELMAGGQVVFPRLAPGSYTIAVGGDPKKTVELLPGDNKLESVDLT